MDLQLYRPECAKPKTPGTLAIPCASHSLIRPTAYGEIALSLLWVVRQSSRSSQSWGAQTANTDALITPSIPDPALVISLLRSSGRSQSSRTIVSLRPTVSVGLVPTMTYLHIPRSRPRPASDLILFDALQFDQHVSVQNFRLGRMAYGKSQCQANTTQNVRQGSPRH